MSVFPPPLQFLPGDKCIYKYILPQQSSKIKVFYLSLIHVAKWPPFLNGQEILVSALWMAQGRYCDVVNFLLYFSLSLYLLYCISLKCSAFVWLLSRELSKVTSSLLSQSQKVSMLISKDLKLNSILNTWFSRKGGWESRIKSQYPSRKRHYFGQYCTNHVTWILTSTNYYSGNFTLVYG